MPYSDSYDTVIVGGGIVGAACLEALTRAGRNVLLLEERRLAQSATGWSGAVVRVAHPDPQSTHQAAFGRRFYQALSERSGGKVSFTRTGYLHFGSPDRIADLDRNSNAVQSGHKVIARAEIAALYPGLDIRADHAVYEPCSGFMDPVATTRALADLGCAQGGEIRECAQVCDLAIAGGQIAGVDTDAGRIKAETVVLATGESTGGLLGRAGLRNDFLRAQLIQVTLFKAPRRLAGAPAFIDDETDTNGVFCPGLGGMYVGLPTGISRESGDRLGQLDQAHAEATRQAGLVRFGWLADARPHGGLCHTDAYSDVTSGLIGACPGGPDGLFLATGFSGGGYKMAPYAGAAIASAISGQSLAAEQDLSYAHV
jgi:glycine/D-amino acid oxidase-like deaminating enzyme